MRKLLRRGRDEAVPDSSLRRTREIKKGRSVVPFLLPRADEVTPLDSAVCAWPSVDRSIDRSISCAMEMLIGFVL
ncbi:hypothetical protein MUK42_35646 [Musa troglodytarum]|uniref:Uncharacterized protein n=1 Tax=Musa troglodytarum TaxID=320322 RepID=A0A9E7HEV1_9LILI|nr:hypothetical protein MUK42_35646 [Musa troglodytarum]